MYLLLHTHPLSCINETMISTPPPFPQAPHPADTALRSGGYCRRCGREHWLGPGNTLACSHRLMELLDGRRTIDLFSGRPPDQPDLATDWLFGPARGKMFGVLECVRPDGQTVFLRAFSGQYNSRWIVEGWVPPVFPVDGFLALNTAAVPLIKALHADIGDCPAHSEQWLALRQKRRELSRRLMTDIFALYTLHNFRGQTSSLSRAFLGNGGLPTGTGDCCAPKLLHYAVKHQLRPVGLSEFFWGRENVSGTRHHRCFSNSCAEKCGPILGFMLCGLDG